jgi:FKBP-type peptidyl-prolyl cis-trans isomerase FkpA
MRFARILSGVLCSAALLACGPGGGGAEGGGPDQAPAAVGEEITTPSGLRITHLRLGEGSQPRASDTVRVHYHGTFPDGKVFDSSVDRGSPAVFPLNRVIPCWTEGVSMMRVGGKARLVCPPAIAYGARGAPPTIPPDATLHFEVELLGIQ